MMRAHLHEKENRGGGGHLKTTADSLRNGEQKGKTLIFIFHIYSAFFQPLSLLITEFSFHWVTEAADQATENVKL